MTLLELDILFRNKAIPAFFLDKEQGAREAREAQVAFRWLWVGTVFFFVAATCYVVGIKMFLRPDFQSLGTSIVTILLLAAAACLCGTFFFINDVSMVKYGFLRDYMELLNILGEPSGKLATLDTDELRRFCETRLRTQGLMWNETETLEKSDPSTSNRKRADQTRRRFRDMYDLMTRLTLVDIGDGRRFFEASPTSVARIE